MRKRLLLVIALTLLIVSCGWRDKYEKERQQAAEKGLIECQSHGQKLLVAYLDESQRWKVICYQESPYKVFTREVD